MKKRIFLAIVALLLTAVAFSQSGKRHMVVTLTARTSTLDTYITPGDVVYIISDSTFYVSKVSKGPSCTGTVFLATRANYNIANYAWVGGAVSATTGAFSSTLAVTGATTLSSGLSIGGAVTGNSAFRGSSNFTTTSTRKAIYISGATSSDYYIVRGIATDAYTRPIAADLLNCYAKTDSLIVMRAAGTTSGMGFTWLRVK